MASDGFPCAFFAAVLLTQSTFAAAQAPVSAPVSPAPQASTVRCELHVWPGRNFHSVYNGWFHRGIVDGAAKGLTGYDNVPHEPLTTGDQRKLLAAIDLPATLGIREYSTVLHETALSNSDIRTGVARHVEEASPCYAELMVDSVILQKNVLSGQALNVIYRFRAFNNATLNRSFDTFIQVPVFIGKAKETTPEAIRTEFARAYSVSVREFGAALTAPPKTTRNVLPNFGVRLK